MSSDDDDDNILIVPTQFSPPNSVGGSPAISPKTSVLMARMAAMHSSKSGDFPVEDMPNEDKIDEYHFTVEKLVIGARRKTRPKRRRHKPQTNVKKKINSVYKSKPAKIRSFVPQSSYFNARPHSIASARHSSRSGSSSARPHVKSARPERSRVSTARSQTKTPLGLEYLNAGEYGKAMDVVTYRHTNPSMLARKNHITTAIASGAVHRNQPVHIVMKKASTANFSASHYNYTPHSHARAQTARSIHTAQSQGVHMPAPFESSYSSTDHGNHRVMGMELGRYMVSSVVDPRPPMGYKHKPKYTVDADFHTTALERREEYITQLERRKRLMKVPKAARLAVEEAMAEEDERKLVEQQRAHQSRLQRREVNRQKKDIHHTLLNPQRRVRDRRENGRDGKYSSTHSVSGAPSPPRASLSIRLTPSLPPIHNRNNNTNDKDSEEENGARGFPSSSGATRTITAKIRRSTHNASKIDRTMDGRKTDDEGEKGAEKTGEGEREGEEEEEEDVEETTISIPKASNLFHAVISPSERTRIFDWLSREETRLFEGVDVDEISVTEASLCDLIQAGKTIKKTLGYLRDINDRGETFESMQALVDAVQYRHDMRQACISNLLLFLSVPSLPLFSKSNQVVFVSRNIVEKLYDKGGAGTATRGIIEWFIKIRRSFSSFNTLIRAVKKVARKGLSHAINKYVQASQSGALIKAKTVDSTTSGEARADTDKARAHAEAAALVPASPYRRKKIMEEDEMNRQTIFNYLRDSSCQLFDDVHDVDVRASAEELDLLLDAAGGSLVNAIESLKSLDQQRAKFYSFPQLIPSIRALTNETQAYTHKLLEFLRGSDCKLVPAHRCTPDAMVRLFLEGQAGKSTLACLELVSEEHAKATAARAVAAVARAKHEDARSKGRNGTDIRTKEKYSGVDTGLSQRPRGGNTDENRRKRTTKATKKKKTRTQLGYERDVAPAANQEGRCRGEPIGEFRFKSINHLIAAVRELVTGVKTYTSLTDDESASASKLFHYDQYKTATDQNEDGVDRGQNKHKHSRDQKRRAKTPASRSSSTGGGRNSRSGREGGSDDDAAGRARDSDVSDESSDEDPIELIRSKEERSTILHKLSHLRLFHSDFMEVTYEDLDHLLLAGSTLQGTINILGHLHNTDRVFQSFDELVEAVYCARWAANVQDNTVITRNDRTIHSKQMDRMRGQWKQLALREEARASRNLPDMYHKHLHGSSRRKRTGKHGHRDGGDAAEGTGNSRALVVQESRRIQGRPENVLSVWSSLDSEKNWIRYGPSTDQQRKQLREEEKLLQEEQRIAMEREYQLTKDLALERRQDMQRKKLYDRVPDRDVAVIRAKTQARIEQGMKENAYDKKEDEDKPARISIKLEVRDLHNLKKRNKKRHAGDHDGDKAPKDGEDRSSRIKDDGSGDTGVVSEKLDHEVKLVFEGRGWSLPIVIEEKKETKEQTEQTQKRSKGKKKKNYNIQTMRKNKQRQLEIEKRLQSLDEANLDRMALSRTYDEYSHLSEGAMYEDDYGAYNAYDDEEGLSPSISRATTPDSELEEEQQKATEGDVRDRIAPDLNLQHMHRVLQGEGGRSVSEEERTKEKMESAHQRMHKNIVKHKEEAEMELTIKRSQWGTSADPAVFPQLDLSATQRKVAVRLSMQDVPGEGPNAHVVRLNFKGLDWAIGQAPPLPSAPSPSSSSSSSLSSFPGSTTGGKDVLGGVGGDAVDGGRNTRGVKVYTKDLPSDLVIGGRRSRIHHSMKPPVDHVIVAPAKRREKTFVVGGNSKGTLIG